MLPPIGKFAPPRYTTNGETMCFLKHMQQASRYTEVWKDITHAKQLAN